MFLVNFDRCCQLFFSFSVSLFMNYTILATDGTPITISIPDIKPPLFSVDFTGVPDGLITNEYAHFNPTDPKSKISPIWDMDSGSLFVKAGQGYSGVPDSKAVDALSLNGNNSAVFRLTTKRKDFGDVSVKLKLNVAGLVSTPTNPPVDYDGIHIFLRYQDETKLYYASINRRQNNCVIKKKIPPGVDNGGTYYVLTPYVPHIWPLNTIQNVQATIKTQSDKSVLIILSVDGKEIVRAVDDGKIGGPPILNPGATGIRGDNCQFTFNNFIVTNV